MSYICEICGKTNSIGRSQQHQRGVAGKRWKNRAQETPRSFKINLQKKTIKVNGVEKQVKVCANCIKRIKKFNAIRGYSNITLV